MAETTLKGESVVVAEIPQAKVSPQELKDFMEKVPGAEIVTQEATPEKPATVQLLRNFFQINPKKK